MKISNTHTTPEAAFHAFLAEQKIHSPWPHLNWESNAWNTDHGIQSRAGARNQNITHFCRLDSTEDNIKAPMNPVFGDYVKALVVRKARNAAVGSTQYRRLSNACRYLEQALIEATRGALPWNLRVEHFAMAERLIVSRDIAAMTKWGLTRSLADAAQLSAFSAFGLSNYRPTYKAPKFRRPVTKDAQAADVAKMIDEEAFGALADLFVECSEPRERIFLNAIALCGTLGFRIGEVLTLPSDCVVVDRDSYGIRYWPEKGGEPHVKWVPKSAQPVVRRAVEELKTLCSKARDLALWQEQNPGLVTPNFEDLPAEISSNQLAEIFNLANHHSANAWAKANRIPFRHQERTYATAAVGAAMKANAPGLLSAFNSTANVAHITAHSLQKIFGHRSVFSTTACLKQWGVPTVADGKGRALYDRNLIKVVLLARREATPVVKLPSGVIQTRGQSLLVLFENQMSPNGANPFVVGGLAYSTVRFWLGEGGRVGSIFDRNNKLRADGTRFVITSHMFRHWVNTMLANGGMSDVEMARWAGRKNISHNKAYIHGTVPRAREAMKDAIRAGKVAGVISDQYFALEPTDRETFLDTALGAVFEMPHGACAHSFAATPCPKHYGCLDGCNKLLRRKGDAAQRASIQKVVDHLKSSIAKTKSEGADDGSPWIVQLTRKLAGAEKALAVDAEPVEDGTVVPVYPDGKDLFQLLK